MIRAEPPAWRPDIYARRRGHLRTRAAIVKAVRAVLDGSGLIEVDTPALQVSPGLEPHLMAFETRLEPPDDGPARPLYLHTSPEFAMKKLLAAGETGIFQIAHVFRNRERSAEHHPEFTMVEWYRAGAELEALMADCEALLGAAAAAAGRDHLLARGRAIPLDQPFERLSVAEAFFLHAGIDLAASLAEPLAPDAAILRRAAREAGVRVADDDGWEDLFFKISLDRIEPHLGTARPTFLTDWPLALAALARPKPDAPDLADRFELYVGGVELANAFGELTDATEQRRRFAADGAAKHARYGLTYPVDADFLAALEAGLPPTAGIALGLDRLVMLATGAEEIAQVLWLPVAGA